MCTGGNTESSRKEFADSPGCRLYRVRNVPANPGRRRRPQFSGRPKPLESPWKRGGSLRGCRKRFKRSTQVDRGGLCTTATWGGGRLMGSGSTWISVVEATSPPRRIRQCCNPRCGGICLCQSATPTPRLQLEDNPPHNLPRATCVGKVRSSAGTYLRLQTR